MVTFGYMRTILLVTTLILDIIAESLLNVAGMSMQSSAQFYMCINTSTKKSKNCFEGQVEAGTLSGAGCKCWTLNLLSFKDI